MPEYVLRLRALTAETPQDTGSLVTLFIQRRRPKGFTADFIRILVNWRAELVCPAPSLVESLLAALLRSVP